ncbi:MAG: hypothetical protein JEZ07_17540 [Phycisphaerae bacterium]|nr:hypothetical protein [Phycisphaerae bacterium]
MGNIKYTLWFILIIIKLTAQLPGQTVPIKYGLELALAADQIEGVSDGQGVSNWPDVSIVGRDSFQIQSAKQPLYKINALNGRPVVSFDGSDDYMLFEQISNVRMVFLVVRENADATANNRCLLGHADSSAFHRGYPRQMWSDAYTSSEVLQGITKINGNPVDGTVTNVPTDFSIISLATVGEVTVSQLTLDRDFAGRVWDGDIAEVLIYSRILSAREENEIGAYLQQKYDIEANYTAAERNYYVPIRPGTQAMLPGSGSSLVLTLDVGKTYQQIKNFGASDCWTVQYLGNWPKEKTGYMADLLFSTALEDDGSVRGIGLSGWRMNIGGGSARKNPSTIYDPWRRSDFYYNANMTGYDFSRCSGQRNFLQLARSRGVDQFTAFAISPPYTMTKNNYTFCDPSVGSTNLDPASHGRFAIYLADVLEHFRDEENIDFQEISPLNEPEWDWNENSSDPGHASQEGCRFSNNDISTFTRRLDAELDSRGIETEIALSDSGSLSYLYGNGDSKGNHIDQFYQQSSGNYIGENIPGYISSHSYWTDTASDLFSKRQALRNKLDQYGLNYEQTEYCILGDRGEIKGNGRDLGIAPALWVARTIFFDMVTAETRSWQWWLGISPHDYKDGLVYTDKDENDGEVYHSKLLWAMGNYSRFIRPGMYRAEVIRSDNKTSADVVEDLMVSGYYSFRHNVAVMVCVNYSFQEKSVNVNFDNLPDGAKVDCLVPYVTAGNSYQDDNLQPRQGLRPGESFAIPARSIVTIVGINQRQGDYDFNGIVDIIDLQELAGQWLANTGSWAGGDRNDKVDLQDFSALSQNWLKDLIAGDYQHYWPFSEADGLITTDSISGTTAELVNMTGGEWIDGIKGKALAFSNANDYVDIPDMTLSGQWTIMFWARGRVSSPYGSIVLGNPNDASNYLYLYDGNYARFCNKDGQYVNYYGDTDFYDQWRHIILVGRDDKVELFIDGRSQGIKDINADFQFNAIGAGITSSYHNYVGDIDEVKVFGRALTLEEILAMPNN